MTTVAKTHTVAGKEYAVKGELPNGVFYLEGPRGGSVLFAKPLVDDLYAFSKAAGGRSLRDGRGLLITATRDELAA